jgi:hypothetical protein
VSAEMTLAMEAVNDANKEYIASKQRYDKASAVLCALSLLENHAAKWLGIKGYYYTAEQEYDDQEYYTQVCIRADVDESVNGYQEAEEANGYPNDDYDILDTWGQDTCAELFTYPENTLSLNDLRQRVIDLTGGGIVDPNG